MKMNIRFTLNKEYTVSRFNPKFEQAQTYLDNEVLKDCTPYVPMNTGALVRSGMDATVLGSGRVIWNAPYASRCYYNSMNFQKKKHPLACSHWFEVAKAQNKQKWLEGVRKVVTG